MDHQNQGINSFPPSDVTTKRKRGRPRKEKGQSPAKVVYVPRKRDPSQNNGNSAPVPPGFGGVNGNQPQSVTAVSNNSANSMVGQVVTGVIEAVFDAGYLLSVRVGESDTNLRGVVFKVGHYVPVSAENDIAPSLQMIRRNEVPFPVAAHSKKRRGRGETEHHTPYPSSEPPSLNQVAQVRARQMSIVAVPAPSPYTLDTRGTVVPVVLQPVSSSTGASPAVEAPPIASQPAHLAVTKSKHSIPTHLALEPKNSHTDNGSGSQHFAGLVSAAKKMKGSPESQNDGGASSSKMVPNDSGIVPEKAEDSGKPLLVKPLQVIHPGMPHQAASIPHPFPERRAGKMTELLLAVQENLERQMSDSNRPEFRNPEN